MAHHDSESDTPSLSEYRDKFSGWRVYFMYFTIVIYAMAASATISILQNMHVPWPVLSTVMLVAAGCAITMPLVLFYDVPYMREHSVWTPGLYRYAFGSTLIGLPGLFVLMFYMKSRRAAVKQTYRVESWGVDIDEVTGDDDGDD